MGDERAAKWAGWLEVLMAEMMAVKLEFAKVEKKDVDLVEKMVAKMAVLTAVARVDN